MSQTNTAVLQRSGAAIAGATFLSLPLGAIYAFSVLIGPLEHLLGVSRSDLASVFGISVVFFTIGTNVAPRFFGLVSGPLLIALSAALSAVGVLIAAFAGTFLWLSLGYGVLFAFGGGVAYITVQQSVNATPIRRPGLVNGYLVSLFPAGAMIATIAFGWGTQNYDVRATLVALALVVAVCGVLATVLTVRSGVRLSGSRAAGNVGLEGERQGPGRAVFWKLFLVFSCAASAGLMVLSQAVVILEAYGAGKGVALVATTAITAAVAAARLGGGFLVDRMPVPVVAASAQSFALLGALTLTLMPRPEVAIVSLAMIGIGYGLISGVMVGAVALYWPKALFGHISSRIYIAWCLAALTLPVVAAKVFDLTGAYHAAILLAGAANLCGVLAGASLPRQRAGQGPRPTQSIAEERT
ncbi:MAG: nitrate/nitrite transporter [Hyphomicrobiaceae bacterium]